METRATQLAVLGGGPGGYAAAFLAADFGIDVTLIDTEPNPGGVCLYRGCIPSKALLHAAKVITEAREAKAFGVQFGPPAIDLNALRAWKEGVVKKLTGGLGQLSRQRSIRFVEGYGRLLDATSLSVDATQGPNEVITFEHLILATGSRPASIPGLQAGSARLLDSTTALDLADIPKRLLVIGGGYIGLELGTVYAALGTEVSVVEMTAGLLPGVDRDLVGLLARRIESICKAVMLETKVVGMTDEKDGMHVRFEGAKAPEGDQVYDKVLVAVGRRPNGNIPGLELTKVQVDNKGFVIVDEQRRTHEPTIFAIGDVAGEPMLAHKASHEGRVAVEVIAGHDVVFEPQAIPAVVFTDPEIAWCGLTEVQAKASGQVVEIARFPWAASGRALTLDRSDGVTKLLIDPETERVLGVGIAGPGAGELIAEGVLAIEMGATAKDIALTIHPHPTLSETLMEASEAFFGQATHIYRKKKN